MNPFFARRTIAEQASTIQSLVDKLCERFREFQASQETLKLRTAFAAMTADVVSLYCYGESYDYLSRPDFHQDLYETVASTGELGLLLKHAPWLYQVLESLPLWLIRRLFPPAVDMMNRRNVGLLFTSRIRLLHLKCHRVAASELLLVSSNHEHASSLLFLFDS